MEKEKTYFNSYDGRILVTDRVITIDKKSYYIKDLEFAELEFETVFLPKKLISGAKILIGVSILIIILAASGMEQEAGLCLAMLVGITLPTVVCVYKLKSQSNYLDFNHFNIKLTDHSKKITKIPLHNKTIGDSIITAINVSIEDYSEKHGVQIADSSLMICSSCRRQVPERRSFCIHCGKNLA